jgi:hypothetical protein
LDLTLPSGHHVQLRDTFMRADRIAAKRALKIDIDPDGTRHMTAALEEEVNGAILREMIVQWDFASPLPRDAATPALAEGILNSVLDDDDTEALNKAIRPFFVKVMRTAPEAEDPNSRPGATVISISAEPAGQETPST